MLMASDMWFDGNTWVIWLALALTLAAIEAATADFTFLMLSGGALAGAVAAGAGADVTIQVITAVVAAIALLLVVRPLAKRKFEVTDQLPMGMQAYVGRSVTVAEAVTASGGRVTIDGQLWSARLEGSSVAAVAGSVVYVTGIDGATAIVTTTPVSPPA